MPSLLPSQDARLRAAAELELRRRERLRRGLLDFIPDTSQTFERPEHLSALAAQIERAAVEPVRYWFTVPPRHGKSETLLHSVPWRLQRDPACRILYATHTATFAATQSKRAKRLCRAVGIEPADGDNRADEWHTEAGGGLCARGAGGEVTGRGFDLVIVDDPVKSRAVAESGVQRDAIWDWLTSDILSRLEPHGSAIVVHTRWHPDDPIGRFERERWPGLCLRAIAEGDDERELGAALWPSRWPAERLAVTRGEVGEYAWASLYQGRPRPRGGAIFGEPHYYDQLPASGYRVAYGVDLAYSARTSADASVCIRLLQVGDTYYVAEVQRKQVDAPAFALTLKSMQSMLAGPMLWHASGTELGSAQFIQRLVPQLRTKPASADKFIRAQAVAAAWNQGKVLVPPAAPWLDAFIAEVCNFTGVNDSQDDQVDALASGHAAMATANTAGAYRANAVRRVGLPQRWI
jgi:predicted phage terminase large subunit-like protein